MLFNDLFLILAFTVQGRALTYIKEIEEDLVYLLSFWDTFGFPLKRSSSQT